MSDDSVFISYRRGNGGDIARTVQEFLEGQGFDVFLDVDGLGSGHFDDQLLTQIAARRSFIFICSEGSLDRCVNEGDWVRREIVHALKTGRHIVPFVMPRFVWPTSDALPQEMAEFQRHNAFEYSHIHWKLIKHKLAEMLRAKPANSSPETVPAPAALSAPTPPKPANSSQKTVSAPAALPAPTPPKPAKSSRKAVSAPAASSAPTPPKPAKSSRKTVSAPAPPKPADSKRALDWCDVVAADPDPAVVTDAAARARMTATKLPWKVRDRKTGIVMLLCPPGEFMMGSPASEAGHRDREAQHSVTITKAFYLSETEVTQEVWQKVMGANPSKFNGANNPVEQVSWNDCQKFCQSSGLRLPSESEWEYACRAGTTTAYSFGASITKQQANFDATRTVACGSLPANQWGFREMHGNVWEWCEDRYETMGSGTQDAVKSESSIRVLRGGSWSNITLVGRSSYRSYGAQGNGGNIIGFRVARAPL